MLPAQCRGECATRHLNSDQKIRGRRDGTNPCGEFRLLIFQSGRSCNYVRFLRRVPVADFFRGFGDADDSVRNTAVVATGCVMCWHNR